MALFLLGWALGVATAYANIGFGQRMVYDLAADLFGHLQRLSLRFHSRQSVGDSIRRVTDDCGCVSTIVKDALLPVVAALVSLVAMFVVMWRLEPRLTLVSTGGGAVDACSCCGATAADARAELRAAGGRGAHLRRRGADAVGDPVVQAFGREPERDRAFARDHRRRRRAALASTTSA